MVNELFMIDFKQYIKELQEVPIDELTEHSKRSALENLLKLAALINQTKKITVLQEPKRKDNYGAPDFKIYSEFSIIGYVENKKITENLDNILNSEQIKKYRELSQNLLITNYLEFIWIKDQTILRETLCSIEIITNSETITKPETSQNLNIEKVERLLLNFFSQVPEKISSSKDLATALANRCKNLKAFINEELTRQNIQSEQERLYDLYNAFKDNVFAELTISEFSDTFAQMLTYGLFLAGLNADTKTISRENAKKYIPANFQLIKELISFLEELEKPEYKETKWIIDEILSIINNIQWADLKKDFQNPASVGNAGRVENDPYIYFYETFLSVYDYNLRKSKGVYYTPPQIVNFIVRCVDEILINTFNLSNGLAERDNVTVLDFATGTGTFLLEVFKIILDKTPNDLAEKRRMIIQDHILKNLFGFEYLIAPYTVAHLKLSQFLKEEGYEFLDKDRLQVYLTNTLEPTDKQIKVPFMPQLSKETKAAQEVKDKPILVIIGNPPYSGNSKNNGLWIKNEIKKYNLVDNKPLGERNPKWLQDDYVKFIRFAQDKMDKVEQGIVAIITNHSFLDNPTFRGMRQSLINTFDSMYFIDLHGNSLKKETTLEGEKDENVFDIQQGVCISLMIKKKGIPKAVFHTDFWGDRQTKFNICMENNFNTLIFNEIKPNSPFYLFVPQNQNLRAVYEKFTSIKDIFDINGVGITTAHDNFCIDYQEDILLKRFNNFKNTERYSKTLHQKFNVVEKKDWDILKGWDNLQNHQDLRTFIKPILYRPFDKRFIFYEEKLVWRTVTKVMKHFEKQNLGLIFTRFAYKKDNEYSYVFASENILDINFLQIPGTASICPLYRYNGNGTSHATNYLFKEDDKKDNFTEQFRNYIKTKYKSKPIDKKHLTEIEKNIKAQEKQLKQIEKIILTFEKTNTDISIINLQKQTAEELKVQIEQKKHYLISANSSQNSDYEPTPEEIFYYIYAILHSPTFREKYAEFLKMDFPRIPFTESLTKFQTLANMGEQLVKKHLLKEIPHEPEYNEIGIFKGQGDKIVINPYFVDNKLYINKTQYFETIEENIYNFYVGGYQVLDKYIKDRKNRELSHNEIDNITNIIKVLNFTIKQMILIDNQTKEWI